MIGWLVFLGLLAAIAAPFVWEHRKPEIDAATRADAPGAFAELSDGLTHYQWHGRDDAPVLVCIHGLTTPSYVWDWLVPGLVDAGFRVLRYDLYGRGYSDRPRGAQTRNFFIRQMRELLQDQGVTAPVSLLGYSMGGSIAAVFAASEPDRVARALLLAPAGMVHESGAAARFAVRVAGLGDWLHYALAGRMLVRGMRSQDGPRTITEDLARLQRSECSWRGYLPAVLSSQRNLLAEPLEEDHRALAELGIPVAAIWGETDSVIPLRAMSKLVEWNRNAQQKTVPGAGHGLAYTHADEVLRAIVAVL